MNELMGRNEYARHRGCAPNAVSKAIDSGRIKAAVVYEAGRFKGIKWREADQLWAGNTDPVEAARNGKFYEQTPAAGVVDPAAAESDPDRQGAAAVAVAAQQPAVGSGDLDLQQPARQDDNANYLKHRAQREEFAAKSAQVEYLKTIGKLVSADAIAVEITDLLNQLKVNALRLPERLAQSLAAETDPARVNRILSDALRSVFDECSRQFADDAAGGVEEPASVSP
jgi:hypothetical protein